MNYAVKMTYKCVIAAVLMIWPVVVQGLAKF